MAATTSNENISGLREQIRANAFQAFPSIIAEHLHLGMKPEVMFDIIVVGCPVKKKQLGEVWISLPEGFRATLVYGDSTTKRKTAIRAGPGAIVELALTALLVAVGKISLGEMKAQEGEGMLAISLETGNFEVSAELAALAIKDL